MKHQTYNKGVLIEERDVPDEPVVLTPEEMRIAAIEVELAALKPIIAKLKTKAGI